MIALTGICNEVRGGVFDPKATNGKENIRLFQRGCLEIDNQNHVLDSERKRGECPPPVAKDTTSRAVKSGFRNTSTSKSLPHGKTLIRSGALSTRIPYFALSCLSTMAVNPGRELWVKVSVTTH
jgi:hypothetical protein